jgi:Holliday junction resolvase RusA-like endonuclease
LTTPLTFSARGTPRPKSRPRLVRGRWVSTANPHEKLWKKAVERAAFAAVIYRGDPVPLFTGPVRVSMVFTFEPPASDRGRIGQPHDQKPDKDNLEKLVLDAMERAGVFRNDSQVAQGPVEKWWGERAGRRSARLGRRLRPAQAPSAGEGDPPGWLATSSKAP